MIDLNRRRFAGLGALFSAGLLAGRGSAANAAEEADPPLSGSLARTLPVADRLDIIELMAVYAWAYDCEEADLLRSTFTPDGELVVFGNLLATAREGFADFMLMAREMKQGKGWQHLADHHVFRDYDGESCKAYSYYTMAEADPQGANLNMRAMGYYDSDCVRTPEGWKFARRTVVRWNGQLPFGA